MSSTRSISLARKLFFAALALLLFFGGLEGALRLVGALILQRYNARVAGPMVDGEGSVWAFGDSYTFGVGADDPAKESYPAVFVRTLSEQGGARLRLRNYAQPGMNSSAAVQRLADRLAAGDEPPELILLLAGVNNIRWLGQSGQFCLEEREGKQVGHSRLQALLRRQRSYKVLRHALLAMRPPRDEDLACKQVAAGFQFLDDGYPDRAQAAFEAALIKQPEGRWAKLGIGLSLLRVGRHPEALSWLQSARDEGLSPPALPLAIGFSLRAAGRHDEVPAVFEASYPDQLQDFAELLRAWHDFDRGRLTEAAARFERLAGLSTALDSVPRGGTVPYALDGLGWSRLRQRRWDEAKRAFEQANQRGRLVAITPHLLGWSHLGRGLVAIHERDSALAIDELKTAGRDSSAVALALAVQGWVVGAERGCPLAEPLFHEALGIVAEQPQAVAGLLRCSASGGGLLPPFFGDGGPAPVTPMPTISVQQWLDPGDTRLVEADLRRALELARDAGSRLVLLTYPQPRAHEALARAILAFGRRSGTLVVDPRARFDAQHKAGEPWEALFIADGHPTTRGYELIGELLAERLGAP